MRIAVKVKELVVMGHVNANSSESEGTCCDGTCQCE